MKFASLALLLIAVVPACGADQGARRGQGGPEYALKRRKPAAPKADDPYKAMTLNTEVGVMDTDDVEATIQDHFDEVRACYARAGKAQQYAGGRVLLRFLVDGDGVPQDVWVLESSLGNYDVERCLVEVGRRIHFHPPGGNKPTTFEYPVEFRSSSGVEVLDIDGPKVEHDLANLLPQLAACGRVANAQVNAIVYVEPNGRPGSVGLATEGAVDEQAGDCVVQTIRGFHMSIGLPGHVVRTNLRIPATIATAEASHRPRHRHH
jgi:TonB family protein